MGSLNLSKQSKAIIALAIVCFFWGTTYLAIRIGLSGGEDVYVHGIFLAAVRQSIAGFILVTWMFLRGVPFPKKKTFLQVSAIGVLLLGMGNGFATWSMQYIPSGFGSVMSASGTILIAIFSHFMIEKIKWTFSLFFGMALGLIGVFGISYDYIESFDNPNFILGIFLNVAAIFVWSFGSVLTAKWKPSVHLLMGAGIQMLVGGTLMWIIIGIVGYENMVQGQIPNNFWMSVIYLIVFGSLLSYTAFMYTLENLPPAQASLYAYINPIVAVLLGWWVLNENLNLLTIASMAVTILAVYIINSNFKKK